VHDAAEAMGGVDAVRGATTLVMEGTGTTYRLGQNPNPDADLPTYTVTSYRKEVDLQNHRWRMEQVRDGNFLTSNPVNQQSVIEAMDKDVAFNIGANGNAQRQSARVALDRHAEFYHHPLTIVQAVVAEPSMATVSNLRQEMGHDIVDVATADGSRLTLHLDSTTKLPVMTESMSDQLNFGDVKIATTFGDYAESGGLQLPQRISQTLDRFPNGDFTVTNQVNAEIGDLAAPADVASASPPEPGAVGVEVAELGDGIWFLRAGYNSVLVEFPTYTVLVEAAQNDARTLAVVQKARELVPNKELRYLVNTHFHIDHSGGVRAAVAEGLTLITHESNRAYFEDIVARPHTVVPDHLAQNPKPLMIETVPGDGPYELKDGDRSLVLYRVKGDVHADGMLMAYLPQERILIQGDLFNPGARAAPFAANFVKQVQELGIRVDRVAPIHGTEAIPYSDVEKAVQELAAQTN
jgi:glyoxylase-like metal-dependent hydrolase (beta-lactamase superfamily II)